MQGVESYQAKQHLNILGPVWQFALNLYQPAEQTMANGGTLLKKGVWTGLADTQFTNIPIRQKKNDSFSILGVAYITRHSLRRRSAGNKYNCPPVQESRISRIAPNSGPYSGFSEP
uniref:Uncharacterized protein n=1 Tax=Eutreptiella gymnastica TaxID=73025 RepID=A0A6T2ENI8_9EUGL